MDIDQRPEMVVQLQPFLGQAGYQRRKAILGKSGLSLDVQDVQEHAPIALQTVVEPGVGGVIELAQEVVGRDSP